MFSAHDADRATLLANIDDHKRCKDAFEPLAVGLFHARRMLHISKAILDILQPSYMPFAYMEQDFTVEACTFQTTTRSEVNLLNQG